MAFHLLWCMLINVMPTICSSDKRIIKTTAGRLYCLLIWRISDKSHLHEVYMVSMFTMLLKIKLHDKRTHYMPALTEVIDKVIRTLRIYTLNRLKNHVKIQILKVYIRNNYSVCVDFILIFIVFYYSFLPSVQMNCALVNYLRF